MYHGNKNRKKFRKNALTDRPFPLDKYSAVINSSLKRPENVISPLEKGNPDWKMQLRSIFNKVKLNFLAFMIN